MSFGGISDSCWPGADGHAQWLPALRGPGPTRRRRGGARMGGTACGVVGDWLGRIQGVLMGPGVSRSSMLWGFLDASDGSGGVDVIKVFSRVAWRSSSVAQLIVCRASFRLLRPLRFVRRWGRVSLEVLS